MKNEEKVVNEIATATVTATEAEVLTENEKGEAVEAAMEVLPVYVERKRVVGSDGRKFWNYFVKGMRKGKEIKADLTPKDMGGYAELDDIFEDQDKVLLTITNGTRDNGGKKVRFTSYSVFGEGDYGIKYSISMKQRESSDLSALEYLIAKARYESEHPEMLQK